MPLHLLNAPACSSAILALPHVQGTPSSLVTPTLTVFPRRTVNAPSLRQVSKPTYLEVALTPASPAPAPPKTLKPILAQHLCYVPRLITKSKIVVIQFVAGLAIVPAIVSTAVR